MRCWKGFETISILAFLHLTPLDVCTSAATSQRQSIVGISKDSNCPNALLNGCLSILTRKIGLAYSPKSQTLNAPSDSSRRARRYATSTFRCKLLAQCLGGPTANVAAEERANHCYIICGTIKGWSNQCPKAHSSCLFGQRHDVLFKKSTCTMVFVVAPFVAEHSGTWERECSKQFIFETEPSTRTRMCPQTGTNTTLFRKSQKRRPMNSGFTLYIAGPLGHHAFMTMNDHCRCIPLPVAVEDDDG